MSTVYIHPSVPEHWGTHLMAYAHLRVAWIVVHIAGISRSYNLTDQRVDVVQQFIDAQGWKGTAINNYHGDKLRNVVDLKNGGRWKLAKGANGLIEFSGGGVVIIWQWDQVFTWLRNGWPTKTVSGTVDSAVGTWCFKEGIDPLADHIFRNEHTGWEYAMKQMRTVGIAKEVRMLSRPLNEFEMIDGLCSAMKRHRVNLDKLHN